MTVSLRWLARADDPDRIALVRQRCYAHADKDLDAIRDRLMADPRNAEGDFLLAESDGEPVGTATALPMHMWVRGGRVACQGVAWVGTVRTHRRKPGGASAGGAGIATQVMRETLRRARERGQVVSALMPWRASFYEHFGYGLVERRHRWTIPLPVLPAGDFDGVRYYDDARDFDALCAARQRIAGRGQCDIERSPALWTLYNKRAADGFQVIDRAPDGAGTVRGWMYLTHKHVEGQDVLTVEENGYAEVPSLLRQLHFLASLRDQYATAVLTLPSDVPLNRLLRESQLPHRPVNHATGACHPYTRMAVRVVDHRRFLEAMRWPADVRGAVTVGVRESEGDVSRFAVDVSDGHARVTPAHGDATFSCTDTTWAAVGCGDVSASAAVALGLAECADPAALGVLDALARGPAPFTLEYF